MGWHEDTVRKIGEYCITKFGHNVQFDEKNGINSLPLLKNRNKRKDNLYFPDIVVRDNKNRMCLAPSTTISSSPPQQPSKIRLKPKNYYIMRAIPYLEEDGQRRDY